MPHTESKAVGPGGDEAERDEPLEIEPPVREPEVEQPEREQPVGESKARGEPRVSTEVPEVHMELVSSGVVEVAPLHVDNSPLMLGQSASGAPGTEASRWGKGHSYSRRRKMMGRKGTMDYMGSSSEE